jgi:hypothetical protein
MNNVTKILVVAGVVGAGYALYRYFKPRRTDSTQEEDIIQQSGETGSGTSSGTGSGNQATYAVAMYTIIADEIYDARMGNHFTGTQEEPIYNAFKKIKNDIDIAKLIQAFGRRRLSYDYRSAGLGGYLSDELTGSEIAKVNEILRGNKVKYQFS